ncbi:TIGR03943 family putative permease subunit [Fictibacillus iocasae]|uniref:TIGR03943 family putative permease subunit n=1 Tax=Fictibacillus iocasae TaxID=2715437 RepID=A0ABW2NIG4_9BACL
MFRIFILLGYTFLFMHLHATGDISKYINMKYAYISFSAIFFLGLLMLVQFYIYGKGDRSEEHCDSPDCGHDHDHEKKPGWRSLLVNTVLLIPVAAGLFLPVATLDSQTVKTKGFAFKGVENEGDFGEHQFLKPDLSVYYGEEGYENIIGKEKKAFENKDTILLNEKDYLKGLELIYYAPGEFIGKDIQMHGFTFNSNELRNKRQVFLLRFGIIHCVADSGVFGMLIEFPDDVNFKDDEWIEVKGKISEMYYQPFKAAIPYVKVSSWKTTSKPKDPYVYRN